LLKRRKKRKRKRKRRKRKKRTHEIPHGKVMFLVLI